jgi:TolB-like protein
VIFTFGDHRLDIERRELRRGGELVGLEPQVFDVLAYLVRHRERVVSQDDLRQAVWSGRVVSYSALASRINAVRRALGDDGTRQQLVRTFARKGVRFVGEVSELLQPPVPGAIAAAEHAELHGPAPPFPDKPSIAVLPFQNMSGDPEQEYFADGMVEEIITALSRIAWLFVIARNSSFSYKGQSPDVKQVGRELGVRYVLEGSVRKAGSQVRIAAQLVEAETGTHLWADRFDGSLEDVFDLQDRVASSVSGVIEPALQAAETARAVRRPTNDLTAYDLYLRALAMMSSAEQIPASLRLLEQAIARDPGYGPALASAAFCCFRLLADDHSNDREAGRLKAIEFARRALQAAGNDPAVLVEAAYALAYFGEDIGAMIALVDRALALNPSFARGWHISGGLRVWAGQPDTGIKHLETALRLSPRARVGPSHLAIGAAHFFNRHFDEALPHLLLINQEDPTYSRPYRYLAACYAHIGRLDDARETVKRLRAVTSVVIPDASYIRNSEHRELYLSGLRLAAGENL